MAQAKKSGGSTRSRSAAKKSDAPSRAASTAEAPYGWDLVGSDGRRIHRGVSHAYATDESARISGMTGEKLKVVASPEPPLAGPTPMPEPEPEPAAESGEQQNPEA